MNESLYPTWYEFKKELQNRLGRPILNQEWLRIKPRKPLPWDESCIISAFSICENSKLCSKS